jgi:hypothetical protein
VAGYTITIAPTDDEAGAQTTIRVDTASGTTRITELTVRAVDGGGLSPQQLPSLNLDQLIAALAPPLTTAIAATPAATETPSAPAGAPEPGVSQDPSAPVAAPSARASRPRAKKVARKGAQKAPARSRQAKVAAAEESSNGRRAYRRMPEPDEVLTAYREAGGTTALARYFGVPRHTATGWLRRLRSQGLLDA